MLVGEYSRFGQDSTTPPSESGSNEAAVQAAIQTAMQQSTQDSSAASAAVPPSAPIPSGQSFLNFLVQGAVPDGIIPLANATVAIVGPNDERSVIITDPGGYARFTVNGAPGTTYHYDITAPAGFVNSYGDRETSDKSDAVHETVTLEVKTAKSPAATPGAPSKTPLIVMVLVLAGIIGANYFFKKY
jgi:hypothetical protein